ncbi:hypothetical protein N1F78_12800 [Seonamhaeicola sp. MEBiC1930]|uniref:hypothetical protein n=1 Tax=Seonamhaeicola sp. MEBiC01930 TaxID=2976768 RepID=UPI00324E633C
MNYILKFVLAFSFLLGSVNVISSQNSSKDLSVLVDKMFSDVINKDFESLLDMTHPKVYDILPRAKMLSVIKMMFEGNEEYSIETAKEAPEYVVSEIYKGKSNNLEYAFVSYDMDMKMTFKSQEFDDEAIKMMTTMMKAQGMDVEFVSSNTLEAIVKNSMTILLKEDATEGKWVLLNYDADSPLFYQVVSSDLVEKAKKYKQDLMLVSKKQSETN